MQIFYLVTYTAVKLLQGRLEVSTVSTTANGNDYLALHAAVSVKLYEVFPTSEGYTHHLATLKDVTASARNFCANF